MSEAYVVVREQPKGSDNYYKYLYTNIRENNKHTTECLQYLGKANGPEDRGITKKKIDNEILEKYDINENKIKKTDKKSKDRPPGAGYYDDNMKAFEDTNLDVQVWISKDINKFGHRDVKDTLESIELTKNQKDSIKTINFKAEEGFEVEGGRKARGNYDGTDKEITIYNVNKSGSIGMYKILNHEMGHNIWNRISNNKRNKENRLISKYKSAVENEGTLSDYSKTYMRRSKSSRFSQEKKKKYRNRALKENFCDGYKMYKNRPNIMKKKYPRTYDAINNIHKHDDK